MDNKSDLSEGQARALATHEHYKGGFYRVIGEARHSETEEWLVVYEQLWPKARGLWVRPREMFHGQLEDGTIRFKPL